MEFIISKQKKKIKRSVKDLRLQIGVSLIKGGEKMRASRGEIKIEEILANNNLNFKMEYSIRGLNSENGRPLRFDFAVFDDDDNLDFLIEYQGK